MANAFVLKRWWQLDKTRPCCRARLWWSVCCRSGDCIEFASGLHLTPCFSLSRKFADYIPHRRSSCQYPRRAFVELWQCHHTAPHLAKQLPFFWWRYSLLTLQTCNPAATRDGIDQRRHMCQSSIAIFIFHVYVIYHLGVRTGFVPWDQRPVLGGQ